MLLIYTLGIRVYGLIILLASPFSEKAKEWVNGRKNFFKSQAKLEGKVYWFHCASLGEFDQGLPVMNEIKARSPEIKILVTFFSPSGFLHHHKRNHPADYVCYLPLDTATNARKFISHFNPEACFFVKYEFWANYILEAKKQGASLYSLSAIFRPRHRFFRWYGAFFRKLLRKFDFFFLQDLQSGKLLESIHINQFLVTGDTRFDRVIENKNNLEENPIIKGFADGANVLIAGSTWPIDENILCPLINTKTIKSKVIIAPHNIDSKHIAEIESKLNVNSVRYTESGDTINKETQVLILDSIGQLAHAYSYGQIAYVGGGFTGKLHNILEPAVFGLPVIFGPKHDRFPEAEQFIDAGIARSISSQETFFEVYEEILKNRDLISKKTSDFVSDNSGSTLKIMEALNIKPR